MGTKADHEVDDKVDDQTDDETDGQPDTTDLPEIESDESAEQRRTEEVKRLKILTPK